MNRVPISGEAAMAARRTRLRLVIFDCDGVLIDSEAVSARLVAERLTALGWPLSAAESQAAFLGMTLTDMVPLIEARLGRPVPLGWKERLTADLITRLGAEVEAVPGAEALLDATSRLGLPWRVASNSSHAEMAVKFGRTGLSRRVAGRLHSHRDVARGKPAPDLFLAAAAAAAVPPEACVVVEDSAIGARGALAAGMDVLGFVPHGDGGALAALGAPLVHSLADLPRLFRLAMQAGA